MFAQPYPPWVYEYETYTIVHCPVAKAEVRPEAEPSCEICNLALEVMVRSKTTSET